MTFVELPISWRRCNWREKKNGKWEKTKRNFKWKRKNDVTRLAIYWSMRSYPWNVVPPGERTKVVYHFCVCVSVESPGDDDYDGLSPRIWIGSKFYLYAHSIFLFCGPSKIPFCLATIIWCCFNFFPPCVLFRLWPSVLECAYLSYRAGVYIYFTASRLMSCPVFLAFFT